MKSFYFIFIVFMFNEGCDSITKIEYPFIDKSIVYSSRRWWNYDIFIKDVYGANTTQLTKNKFIDFNPSVSRDSNFLAFISDRDGNREIYICELEWLDGYSQWRASNLRNITNSSLNDWTPVFSPIENKIAFATYFPENDNYDIFIMNYDGTNKENITNTTSYEKYPQFSPDGSYLIFQGWYKGKMEIYFSNLLEKNLINLTKNPLYDDILPHGNAFSADGEFIVFTSNRDGNMNIYLMNANGNDQIQLTSNESSDYEPIFSPDGKSIIFTSERDGNKEIYSIDIQSKSIENLTKNPGDDWNPRFFSDGTKIVFQSSRDGNWEIYLMKKDGSDVKNISNHPSTDYSYVVLSPPNY